MLCHRMDILFHRCGNWGTEKLGDLFKATQLLCGKARLGIQVVWSYFCVLNHVQLFCLMFSADWWKVLSSATLIWPYNMNIHIYVCNRDTLNHYLFSTRVSYIEYVLSREHIEDRSYGNLKSGQFLWLKIWWPLVRFFLWGILTRRK